MKMKSPEFNYRENNEQKNEKTFFEKIRNLSYSINKKLVAFGFIFTMGKIGHEIHTLKERDDIEIKIDTFGNNEYEHSDKQTTQYLNYISGKGVDKSLVKSYYAHNYIKHNNIKLNEQLDEKKIDSLAQLSYRDFKDKEIELYERMCEIEKNITCFINDEESRGLKSEMLKAELEEAVLHKNNLNKSLKEMVDSETFFNSELSKMNEIFSSTFNRDYYEFIWNLESKNGKPRIRSIVEDQQSTRNPYRAYYVSRDNTMYIDDTNLSDDFLAELAHAQQFSAESYGKIMMNHLHNMVDNLKIIKKAIMDNKISNFQDKMYYHQLEEYDDPSTIEYEAHEIIEKKFKKQIDSILSLGEIKMKIDEIDNDFHHKSN